MPRFAANFGYLFTERPLIERFAAAAAAGFKAVEQQLAQRPKIQVPSITLYGANDGVARPSAEATPAELASFTSLVARRVVPGAGHFLPREKPEAVSSAMLELLAKAR